MKRENSGNSWTFSMKCKIIAFQKKKKKQMIKKRSKIYRGRKLYCKNQMGQDVAR